MKENEKKELNRQINFRLNKIEFNEILFNEALKNEENILLIFLLNIQIFLNSICKKTLQFLNFLLKDNVHMV